MTAELSVVAIVLCGASGLLGLSFSRQSRVGEHVSFLLYALGAVCGISAGVLACVSDAAPALFLEWRVPGGALAVGVDAISGMFLLQIFVIPLFGALYGLGYWPQREHAKNGRSLRLFYGLVTAGMALVVVAKNSVLFLAGWEVMALSAFLLLTTEHEQAEVRHVGYVYLGATRVGTLCLFAMFSLLYWATGGFSLIALPDSAAAVFPAIFLLALVGFGLKAGIMPLHIWLPGAHAAAPSHVSALMSGVLLKTGIYGLVRITSLVAAPPLWWGELVTLLGVVSGVGGVLFAIGQHDLKRLLAYHSVENIGIICIGLGVGLIGQSIGDHTLAALGIAGALLHVWNHGLFKALLFLSAGAVVHTTHTRDIDHLGGLLKRMPWTGFFFLLGAVAICGLPPLNGFVSELLVYLGLFRSLGLAHVRMWLVGAAAAPALALIGGLALACFVKAFGAVFLGGERSPHAAHAHEVGWKMLTPMAGLALLCVGIGVLPVLIAPVLERAAGVWIGGDVATPIDAPFSMVALGAGLLIVSLLGVGALLFWRVHKAPRDLPTWDCGYAAPSNSMQYTSSSFADWLVGLFAFALRPRVERPVVRGIFPRASSMKSDVPDVVLDRWITPFVSVTTRVFERLRWLQGGNINAYMTYVLITLLLLLALRGWVA